MAWRLLRACGAVLVMRLRPLLCAAVGLLLPNRFAIRHPINLLIPRINLNTASTSRAHDRASACPPVADDPAEVARLDWIAAVNRTNGTKTWTVALAGKLRGRAT